MRAFFFGTGGTSECVLLTTGTGRPAVARAAGRRTRLRPTARCDVPALATTLRAARGRRGRGRRRVDDSRRGEFGNPKDGESRSGNHNFRHLHDGRGRIDDRSDRGEGEAAVGQRQREQPEHAEPEAGSAGAEHAQTGRAMGAPVGACVCGRSSQAIFYRAKPPAPCPAAQAPPGTQAIRALTKPAALRRERTGTLQKSRQPSRPLVQVDRYSTGINRYKATKMLVNRGKPRRGVKVHVRLTVARSSVLAAAARSDHGKRGAEGRRVRRGDRQPSQR